MAYIPGGAAPYWCAASHTGDEFMAVLQAYFFLRAGALRATFRGFAGAAAATTAAGGMSPMTPLSGQILKIGHFLQPATMAIGQMVILIPLGGMAAAAV